jgi:HlyD family secretion protein
MALLAWLMIGGWTKGNSIPLSYYPVKRTDFLISVVEGGTVKAVHEVTVRSELEGVARIISIVPEGTFAKKGDLLVELDSADLRERISGQEVTYQNAHFAALQAKEYLSIQKSLTESNIKDAEVKEEFAQTDLQKYKEGDWPQLKKNSDTKIKITEIELKRANDRLSWTQQLEKKGYASRSELEADSLTVEKSEIGVDQAKEELRLLEKFDRPKRIRQLEVALEQAGKELERIKLRSAAQIAQAEAELEAKTTALELQEARRSQLKAQLELTRIYAPEAGLVVYASSSNPGNGVLIEEGATIRQKQDIIKLPDISQMMVEIRVHESHVQKIRPGLTAYVSIDSLPDEQFRGTVRRVAVLPDSTSRYFNPNLKVYTTEVQIEDELPDLKPGISGRAEIVITNLTHVLTVPIQAVTTVKGRQVCLVERGALPVPVPVEVGLYNEKYIEIKSGLNEGDQVLLSPLGSSDNIDLSHSVIAAHEQNTSSKSANKSNGSNDDWPRPRHGSWTNVNLEHSQLAVISSNRGPAFLDLGKAASDPPITHDRERKK